MRVILLLVFLSTYWVGVTWAGASLGSLCAMMARGEGSSDPVLQELCGLEASIAQTDDALEEVANEVATAPGSEGEQMQIPAKRKNEFIRFGKRKNEFIRFGKRGEDGSPAEKRKNEFVRFGKRKNEFVRFGKRKNEFVRFGKRKNEFVRFGKRKNEFVRFGKRKNEFVRFGKKDSERPMEHMEH
jgi:hypothetical protein